MDKETLSNYVSCFAFNMVTTYGWNPEIIRQGDRRHG